MHVGRHAFHLSGNVPAPLDGLVATSMHLLASDVAPSQHPFIGLSLRAEGLDILLMIEAIRWMLCLPSNALGPTSRGMFRPFSFLPLALQLSTPHRRRRQAHAAAPMGNASAKSGTSFLTPEVLPPPTLLSPSHPARPCKPFPPPLLRTLVTTERPWWRTISPLKGADATFPKPHILYQWVVLYPLCSHKWRIEILLL